MSAFFDEEAELSGDDEDDDEEEGADLDDYEYGDGHYSQCGVRGEQSEYIALSQL